MPTRLKGFCQGGCGKKIYEDNRSGLCQACFNNRKHQQSLDLAKREAEGRLDPLGILKTENTQLRADLSKARDVIHTYQSRARFEDKLLREVVQFIEGNPYKPVLVKPSPGTGAKAGAHEMLAHLSDAHYPEQVDPDQTFGLKYDADVCRRRLEYFRDKVVRYMELRRQVYPLRKLTVNVNGDMISGDIHDELEVTNQTPITESVVRMAYMLFDLGCAFAESVESVEFIVMPGNHPRLQKKPRFKQKWNNWEYVMGHMLRALAGDRFTVTVPKDLVYRFKIFHFNVGVSHGDGIKSNSFAGIPFYGMRQRQDALQALLKTTKEMQLDMLCYGHFHQLIYQEGQGCSLFINGSVKGGDEFSTGVRYAAQAPVQGLMTFHPKHGMTDLSRINLGHIQ